MKVVKTFAIIVCASLLSATILGSARHAYAQDEPEGAWSAGSNANSEESSSPDMKAPPLIIAGCWQGDVQDKHDGTGTANFGFFQNPSGKKLVASSSFDFEWPDQSFAHGPIKGTVTSKGFKFKGNAGKGCPVHGSASGDETGMTGTAKFGGECAKFFKDVTFSITPGCQ
jgi:hypothetical protein